MKLNRRNLFTRAWDIRRADDCSMAEALRRAWSEIKEERQYTVNIAEKADAIRSAIGKIVVNTIHDIHKVDILRAVLRLDLVDGCAAMPGKWCGLVKWAVKNA